MIQTLSRWFAIEEYRNLVKNYSSLGLVQLSNYILPLLTLPYLSRVLGVDHFGLVMMAQAIMIYLTLLTDYGFNLSATKEIAKNHTCTTNISNIFSSVIIIKLSLLIISFGILMLIIQFIPLLSDHSLLFYLSFLIVIGNTFLPTFLFQGIEKMSYLAFFNLIAKISFTGLIFIIIQSKSDYYLVHALWGISYIIVNLISFYIIIAKLNIKLIIPPFSLIKKYYSLSFEYFLSRISVAIYLNANIIIIGIILSPVEAGYYSGAEKLIFAITTFYAPLIETIYPYVARSRNFRFIKKLLLISVSVNTIGCLAAYFLAPVLIPLILGAEFIQSVHLFQWLLIIALLHLPISMIGYPVLGALGYEKTANRSAIIGAIVHMSLMIGFYNSFSTPLQFIWIMIASQSIIFIIRLQKLISIQQSQN